MASKIASFTLNDRETEALIKPLMTLQRLLRDNLGYTATKTGCRQGGCGGCTVLVDGEPMASCLLPVEDVIGKEVTTLEGITPDISLHPLQASFYENFATQCGYCTPGMIVTSKALLDRNPDPSRQEIIDALTGNLCRCTGYLKPVEAARAVAAALEVSP